MTENNADDANTIDATPTVSQPVHIGEEQSAGASAPVAVGSKPSHVRTILEIVGGVVAVGLIFASGAVGFVLGHVTAKHDGRGDGTRVMQRLDPGADGRYGERGHDSRGGRPGFPGMPGPNWAPGLEQQGAPTIPQG